MTSDFDSCFIGIEQVFGIDGKLEHDVVDEILVATSESTHLCGLDCLELVRRVALGDDDPTVGLGAVDKVLRKVRELRVDAHTIRVQLAMGLEVLNCTLEACIPILCARVCKNKRLVSEA